MAVYCGEAPGCNGATMNNCKCICHRNLAKLYNHKNECCTEMNGKIGFTRFDNLAEVTDGRYPDRVSYWEKNKNAFAWSLNEQWRKDKKTQARRDDLAKWKSKILLS